MKSRTFIFDSGVFTAVNTPLLSVSKTRTIKPLITIVPQGSKTRVYIPAAEKKVFTRRWVYNSVLYRMQQGHNMGLYCPLTA